MTMPACPWTERCKTNWADAVPRMQAWWDGTEMDWPIVLSPVLKAPRPWQPPRADAAELERRSADSAFYVEWRRHHLRECHFVAEAAMELTRQLGPAGLAFRLPEVTSVTMMEATMAKLQRAAENG